MSPSDFLSRWFDVRPDEARKVILSFLGAYGVMSFLILGKSLREAFYLSTFDVTTLPYITIAAAVLSLPSAGLFGRMMGGENPHRVFAAFIVALGGALVLLQTLGEQVPETATLAFYLVTLLGTSLLTSGFWLVTAEQFSMRQAKRLFGVIGAGGTLGAMVTGVSLGALTDSFTTVQLVFGLVVLLAAVLVLQWCMPRLAPHHHHGDGVDAGIREGLARIVERPHLRNIATIVLLATMASTILDYQFKEIVSAQRTTSAELASFFGAFYGWTGLLSLIVQVLLVGRLMTLAGIASSLAVLPVLLVIGSAGMLVAPSLVLATMTRGADNSLRKSLHRSVLEYLYVPVPATVRRRTKAFIDSVVDNAAAGLGAVVLFLWITWGQLPSRYLSLLVIVLAGAFIWIGVETGAGYTRVVRDRLAAGSDDLEVGGFDARSLLTVTLTRVDVASELAKAGVVLNDHSSVEGELDRSASTLERICSTDRAVVRRALDECTDWREEHVEPLTRLLAHTDLYAGAVDALLSVGDPSLQHLTVVLLDEHADFVIRRRIPRILSSVDTAAADSALLEALAAGRFEVRYRAAIALARRRKADLATAGGDWRRTVWAAIEREVSRDRPIWELQQLLDGAEAGDDGFVGERLDVRGELSLEHTFRQLSLVLDAEPVKMAFHGVVHDDEHLKGLALEYLEQVLPAPIRERLWPFIGDISEHQRRRSLRSVAEVVRDLSKTGATLFGGDVERAALRDALRDHGDRNEDDKG